MSERGGRSPLARLIDLLHEEFPDISISKLRFLESQAGRSETAGYRQFRAPDVERIVIAAAGSLPPTEGH